MLHDRGGVALIYMVFDVLASGPTPLRLDLVDPVVSTLIFNSRAPKPVSGRGQERAPVGTNTRIVLVCDRDDCCAVTVVALADHLESRHEAQSSTSRSDSLVRLADK
jgi:hypothetical protein